MNSTTAWERGKYTSKKADGSVLDRGKCSLFVQPSSSDPLALAPDLIVWKHEGGKWLMKEDSFNSDGFDFC